jgi:dihydrodiol dehydrogenase / D-xylose 1-dehydrogenase (NADP)
MSCLLLQLGIF